MDPKALLAKETADLEARLAAAKKKAVIFDDAEKFAQKHGLKGIPGLLAILTPAETTAARRTSKGGQTRTEVTPKLRKQWNALLKKNEGNVARSAREAGANEITFRKYTVGKGRDRRYK